MKAAILSALFAALASTVSSGQGQKPQIELTPSPATAAIAAGGKGRVSLKVKLPKDVHVQSDKPDDPSLIATVLTVTPAPSIAVDRIVYPEAARIRQAGLAKPLAVFGPELVIDVHLSVAPGTVAGRLALPAQLRYQACNAKVASLPLARPSSGSSKWHPGNPRLIRIATTSHSAPMPSRRCANASSRHSRDHRTLDRLSTAMRW